MKTAVLAVSFGTSYRSARENSLDKIEKQLREAGRGFPLYRAYTSGMIIQKLAEQEHIFVDTVEKALRRAAGDGIERLYVIPTHMIPGIEYEKMKRELGRFQENFREIRIASAVLDQEEDCERLIPVLCEMLRFEKDYEYILMGHGTEDVSNIRYTQMNEAFLRAGMTNVQIASVEAKPDLEDALRRLRSCGTIAGKKVILHPFMVVAGDHAHNDMAGDEDSYVTRLKEAGLEVRAIVKGLGEYPQFRRIYVDKLTEMLESNG